MALAHDDPALATLARRLGQVLAAHELRLATAESCTGGWIAKLLTDIPGSSGWFEYGLVTYGNAAKRALLDVPETTLATHGAVSATTVEAMARGVLRHGAVDCSIAVSGIAGPGGGSPEKPVGTVWLGWSLNDAIHSEHHLFTGDREAIRRQAVACALTGLLDRLPPSHR